MVLVNQLWYPGKVRIRAKAVDPLEGVKGKDYIAARNLGALVQRIVPATACKQRES
jgi:hypothetical protein